MGLSVAEFISVSMILETKSSVSYATPCTYGINTEVLQLGVGGRIDLRGTAERVSVLDFTAGRVGEVDLRREAIRMHALENRRCRSGRKVSSDY